MIRLLAVQMEANGPAVFTYEDDEVGTRTVRMQQTMAIDGGHEVDELWNAVGEAFEHGLKQLRQSEGPGPYNNPRDEARWSRETASVGGHPEARTEE